MEAVPVVPDISGGRAAYQQAASRWTLPFLSFSGKDNRLAFRNEGMKDHKLTRKDKEKTKSILEKIEKTLKESRRMRRLELFVGGRRKEIDYRLLVRLE
ncbi:hypothetical protein Tco_0953853 [Tanacetum coccineum]|uniref:Uncharacterized protein n=1 Tax=Tanacetum coccineum TaxID=301880 RepID=A0ABQ5E2X5_9ASTR